MKSHSPLAISIALNLILIAMLLRANRETPPLVATPPPAVTTPAPIIQTNILIKRFDWQSVEADEYTKYIANLRSIGCPEETIEDIVVADVFKMFESKKREALDRLQRPEYWKANLKFRGSLTTEAFFLNERLSQPFDSERNALLRSLGIEPNRVKLPQSTLNARNFLLNFLSNEKREKILALDSRGAEELNALRANSQSEDTFQIYQKHTKELEQRIKALLTPEEALQYDLRFSRTADYLRTTLSGFEATEEEFVQLFKLRSAYVAKTEDGEITSAEDLANREILDQEIKAKLGEARFADYERAGDHGFQQIWGAALKTGLPLSKAIEAFDIRRAAMGKAYELREAALDNTTREAALSAIRDETEKILEDTLGADAWREYESPLNLDWLERISRRLQ